ncbi:hypothetical protein ACFSJY_06485 [Thalassotalea euphylliae]
MNKADTEPLVIGLTYYFCKNGGEYARLVRFVVILIRQMRDDSV